MLLVPAFGVAATIVLSISTTLCSSVEAHGYIAWPRASYYDEYTKTKYRLCINESISPAFEGRKWNDSPANNSKTFADAFRASNLTSLRAFLDPVAPDCGNSRTDVAPIDVTGLRTMQFENDEYHEGFISSHEGPCEAWIDESREFQSDDCAAEFRSYPAMVPVNYSSCAVGATCTLTFYWLPVHEPQWQVYKQCVRITRTGDQ